MRLVVVGDSLLDVDVEGTAERLCPDAPAPVLDVSAERARPGGAALAATMASRDGVDVTLVSALADDEDGHRIRSLLDVPGVFGPSAAPTSVKTRLRCGGTSLGLLLRQPRPFRSRPTRGCSWAASPHAPAPPLARSLRRQRHWRCRSSRGRMQEPRPP